VNFTHKIKGISCAQNPKIQIGLWLNFDPEEFLNGMFQVTPIIFMGLNLGFISGHGQCLAVSPRRIGASLSK
jgi:hypothetical protein